MFIASHVLPDLGPLLVSFLFAVVGIVASITMIVFAAKAKPKSKSKEDDK